MYRYNISYPSVSRQNTVLESGGGSDSQANAIKTWTLISSTQQSSI